MVFSFLVDQTESESDQTTNVVVGCFHYYGGLLRDADEADGGGAVVVRFQRPTTTQAVMAP